MGVEITMWLDLPPWMLELALDECCGYWLLTSDWLDFSFHLVCY